MRKAAPALAFVAVLGATVVAFFPLCGLLHRCGCEAPWAGGESRCNVHNLEGPHCPWCEYYGLGGFAAAGTVGGQAVAFWLVRRRGGPWLRGALAALAALPVSLVASGAVAWLATDYPHFLAVNARARLGIPKGPLRCVVTRGSTTGRDGRHGPKGAPAETVGGSP